jgi:TetR/AcrR family transcriptional regulator of autoinduction and epiphytic fitness
MTEVAEDGRVARGLRTREAVMDTLLDLYAEGSLTPTVEEIAARIGRTSRAIYHHFQDREALARAMAERHLVRHQQLFDAGPIAGTRTERIDGIATHRAELFEAIGPNHRAALVTMHTSPEIQTQQAFLANHLRQQLTGVFEPELSALSRTNRAEVLDLLDLHTSWETWERLRTWQGLSIERSRQLVTGLVTQALER